MMPFNQFKLAAEVKCRSGFLTVAEELLKRQLILRACQPHRQQQQQQQPSTSNKYRLATLHQAAYRITALHCSARGGGASAGHGGATTEAEEGKADARAHGDAHEIAAATTTSTSTAAAAAGA